MVKMQLVKAWYKIITHKLFLSFIKKFKSKIHQTIHILLNLKMVQRLLLPFKILHVLSAS